MSKPLKRKHEKDSKGWSSLPWKKLNVSMDGKGSTLDGHQDNLINDEEFLNAPNHYDDPHADPNDLYDPFDEKHRKVTSNKMKNSKRVKGGKREEEDGADDPGILLGLEVIDGSKYRVEKVQSHGGGYVTRLIWNDESNPGAVQETQTCTKDAIDKEIRTKAKRKKNKKKQNQGPNLPPTDEDNTKMGSNKNDTDEKRKQESKLPIVQTDSKAVSLGTETAQENLPVLQLPDVDQEKMELVQTSWAVGTGGAYLHPHICYSLAKLGFSHPTPIQASTLAASILGKRDIAGAAPTGSGKTMAYCIPILQFFLENNNMENNNSIESALTALILCPTRELALQVTTEFDKLSRKLVYCGSIVGGLAEEKQKRILDVKRPPVLVATPGRLWSLMSSKDHKHLNDLSKLRFLVVDEVDRMISKGSYPQLLNIFESINKANPIVSESEPSRETMQEDDSDDDGSRLKGLKGIPGESRVVMLNEDVLKQIEAQKKGYVVDTTDQGQDDHSSQSSIHFESMPHNDHDDDDDQSLQSGVAQEIIHRQTFVFSATLSLPNTAHQIIKQARTSLYKKGKALDSNASVESTIQDILRTAGARGQLKFVDLSTNSSNPSIHDKSETLRADRKAIQLPPGLSLYEILCTKKHKDSHLYAFLVTTKQGSSGPCLVFCNSIAAVKRVSQTLRELGLPVRTLHAHMEQKARLSAIESLKGNDSRVILIATDVAARGLDIPSVANVIHYDVARAVDTFVHRAGRTARGVGSSAVGTSVSLVDPSEEKSHRKICESIRGQGIRRFEQPSIDGHLLSSAQTRVALASKIVDSDMIKVKARKNNDWISVAAADADLDLDEDLLDQGPSDGSLRDQQRLKEVSKARLELKRLLAVPMKKQHFGKFLSGVGIKNAINSMGSVVPYVVGHK